MKNKIVCCIMLWLIFGGLIAVVLWSVGDDISPLLNGADEIYYDSKLIIALAGIPFFVLMCLAALINIILTETKLKKNKKRNDVILERMNVLLVLSVCLFMFSFIPAYILTFWVRSHYTPCHDTSIVSSGTTYVKGNATCDREMYTKEDGE
ncbi:DUF1240 domain-containing protein [Superficieibacter electus]|uniref:DUF1240 domain-containing protein n=1 Tax=Superficieibacter electus TaxID=2022662 RepID=UPI00159ECB53|nr:DUF1240 domain-containing protein [Superficieibacter electus]